MKALRGTGDPNAHMSARVIVDMGSRRALERQLATLAGFADPRVELEQYATPADVAASLLHLADLQGDFDDVVVDLGTGTGILALGAALRGCERVIGLELDPTALAVATRNQQELGLPKSVDWIHGAVESAPLCLDQSTVLMNPPFGAQKTNIHADRAFLTTTARIAAVSYSVHNAGSRDFIEAYTEDQGGTITHAYETTIELDRQFAFHSGHQKDIPVEIYRITWD